MQKKAGESIEIPMKEVSFYCLDNEETRVKYEPEEYIFLTDLNFYISEITKMALRKTSYSFKNILLEFSTSFIKKEHLYLKQFSFINATYLNKIGFVSIVARTFELKPKCKIYDAFQLIRLLCADFSKDVFMLSARLASGDYETEEEELLQFGYLPGTQFLKGEGLIENISIYENEWEHKMFLKIFTISLVTHRQQPITNIYYLSLYFLKHSFLDLFTSNSWRRYGRCYLTAHTWTPSPNASF
jgi:hypothetical protein